MGGWRLRSALLDHWDILLVAVSALIGKQLRYHRCYCITFQMPMQFHWRNYATLPAAHLMHKMGVSLAFYCWVTALLSGYMGGIYKA